MTHAEPEESTDVTIVGGSGEVLSHLETLGAEGVHQGMTFSESSTIDSLLADNPLDAQR